MNLPRFQIGLFSNAIFNDFDCNKELTFFFQKLKNKKIKFMPKLHVYYDMLKFEEFRIMNLKFLVVLQNMLQDLMTKVYMFSDFGIHMNVWSLGVSLIWPILSVKAL